MENKEIEFVKCIKSEKKYIQSDSSLKISKDKEKQDKESIVMNKFEN